MFWTSSLFFNWRELNLLYDQILCWAKQCIIDKKNLPFDPDVRQWSHCLMITKQFLWAKSNNGTRCQFECDVTWFCFYFDFVCSHVRSECCSIICLLFQIVQIKQTGCKLSTKNVQLWTKVNKRYFVIFFDKAAKKQIWVSACLFS